MRPAMDTTRHGPFLIEPDGTLRPLRPPALRFAWRDRDCEAVAEGAALRAAALAGRVPFTVEAPAARARALAAVAALRAGLPHGWRLGLLPDQRVRLEAEVPLPGTPSTAGIVAGLVRFALDAGPYLDRLAAAGLGRVKT